MNFAAWNGVVTDPNGRVMPFAKIEVRAEDSGRLARLFSDRYGTKGMPNPFTADEDGQVNFFTVGDAYRITAISGSMSREWRYVAIGTAQQLDIETFLSNSGYDAIAQTPAELAEYEEESVGFRVLVLKADDENRTAIYELDLGTKWIGPIWVTGRSGLQGEQGEEGPEGKEGPIGPMGDVTPEAEAARNAAVVAKDIAAQKADISTSEAAQSKQERIAAELAAQIAITAKDAAFVNAAVYPDIAAGLASTVSGGQFQVVSGDEIIRYRNDSGIAVEVARYPSSEKVDAIPAQIDLSAPDAEQLVDDIGQIIRRTDAAGHVFIPDMEGRSVQQHAAEVRSAVHQGSGFRPRDVFQVETERGNVTLRQDATGGLFLPGMGISVQAALNMPVDREVRFPTDDREKLHPAVKPLIADLVVEGRPFIDPPRALVPNLYEVPDSIVSAFSVPPPSPDGVRYFATPHYPGHLVHPFLLEMRKPVLGYRYLFADTPHGGGGAKMENPCLFGTNDLNRFDILPGVPQPLGRPPEYPDTTWNADVGFTYDPRNGELVCFWRGGAGEHKSRSTWNGADWTTEAVAEGAGGDSPSILYDPVADIWHLWAKTGLYTAGHWTGSSHQGPWVYDSAISAGGIGIWHFEVKYIGEKFIMLLNQHTDNNTRPSNLYLGISSDGLNFTFGPPLVQEPAGPVYKGTFEVLWDGPNLTLIVGWNSYTFPDIGVPQHLYIQKSNTVDVSTL